MTIKTPPQKIWDDILNFFGKKRRVIIPKEAGEVYDKYGQYSIIKARKENFWIALFRKQ